jgi:adenine-specific DNA-methyltransferase
MLEAAAAMLDEGDLFSDRSRRSRYTHAILNPPYRKINTDSEARRLIRRTGLETSNLYAGFLWFTARLLEAGGQMVAITPRSFCNGPYFLPFRKQFFDLMTMEWLHVFDRRDTLFSGDDVLQENLVMAARRCAGPREAVVLSGSDGRAGGAARSRTVPYLRVVDPRDTKRIVHFALEGTDDEVRRKVLEMGASLADVGMDVSTGRVVDFRARDFLRREPGQGTVPLIYPLHVERGGVRWPSARARKPNALVCAPETAELVLPNGCYVLVKRFTAKEERRRVVATVFRPEGKLRHFSAVGFENHLNYFHKRGAPLDETLARGLAIYLNSSLVDSYFRQFSGHTQVNATDLRSLRYPRAGQLRRLAESVQGEAPDQAIIDGAVGELTRTSRP